LRRRRKDPAFQRESLGTEERPYVPPDSGGYLTASTVYLNTDHPYGTALSIECHGSNGACCWIVPVSSSMNICKSNGGSDRGHLNCIGKQDN
jgi:hypothetical protein